MVRLIPTRGAGEELTARAYTSSPGRMVARLCRRGGFAMLRLFRTLLLTLMLVDFVVEKDDITK